MKSLEINNIGKSYKLYSTQWKRVLSWFGIPFKPINENWILRGVNFSIDRGEAIGIVGQNGAGKSTLLKMITGTQKPTEGGITVIGKISAILELGMGFHPELTGRQNARHGLGLMGYSQAAIDKVMSSVEEFAEIHDYFDQPVRTYSSGMNMRVAFAVSTAFRPDILIVDEALSVGDAYFQHRCFDRIREFQEQGTTLLIVSHDRSAIQGLCDRAILLENGSAIKDGRPEEVFDFYNAIIAKKEDSSIDVKILDNGKAQTISGTGEAQVEEIALYNSKGNIVEDIAVGENVELRIKVKVHKHIDSLVLGYGIKDRLGQVMYGTNTFHTDQVIFQPKVGESYQFVIAFSANLGEGNYSIQTALVDKDTHLSSNYEWRDLALVFNVINVNKKHFAGCLWSEPVISIEECVR